MPGRHISLECEDPTALIKARESHRVRCMYHVRRLRAKVIITQYYEWTVDDMKTVLKTYILTYRVVYCHVAIWKEVGVAYAQTFFHYTIYTCILSYTVAAVMALFTVS